MDGKKSAGKEKSILRIKKHEKGDFQGNLHILIIRAVKHLGKKGRYNYLGMARTIGNVAKHDY